MLTRTRVVEAAVQVAAELGFGALSTREISTVLGVSPMAIYRHVPSMDELRAEVADRVLRDVTLPGGEVEPRERLRRVLAELHGLEGRYDGSLLAVARGPVSDAVEEHLRSALVELGFSAQAGEPRLQLLLAWVIGVRPLESRHARESSSPSSSFGETLEVVLASVVGGGDEPRS
jgi:AcrR family transcriptional regulator